MTMVRMKKVPVMLDICVVHFRSAYIHMLMTVMLNPFFTFYPAWSQPVHLRGRWGNKAFSYCIKGVVCESATGKPISDASVEIVGTYYSCKTDVCGKYNINALLPRGFNVLMARHEAYETKTVGDAKFDTSSIKEVDFYLDTIKKGRKINMPKQKPPSHKYVKKRTTGSIIGTVKCQKTGIPISNAIVNIVGTSISDTTNFSGDYLFRHVPAGRYTMRATSAGYDDVAYNIKVTIDSLTNWDFFLIDTL